jgi:hypothetical protein
MEEEGDFIEQKLRKVREEEGDCLAQTLRKVREEGEGDFLAQRRGLGWEEVENS